MMSLSAGCSGRVSARCLLGHRPTFSRARSYGFPVELVTPYAPGQENGRLVGIRRCSSCIDDDDIQVSAMITSARMGLTTWRAAYCDPSGSEEQRRRRIAPDEVGVSCARDWELSASVHFESGRISPYRRSLTT